MTYQLCYQNADPDSGKVENYKYFSFPWSLYVRQHAITAARDFLAAEEAKTGRLYNGTLLEEDEDGCFNNFYFFTWWTATMRAEPGLPYGCQT